jgi:hypothetical protein
VRPRHAAFAVLAVGLVLAVHGALEDAPTVDEFAHLPAGCALLRYGAFHHYPNNPPLAKMLMAVPVVLGGATVPRLLTPEEGAASDWAPWIYGGRFMSANAPRYFGLFFRARLVMIGIFLSGGVVLALFARALFGWKAGLGALFLYVLCPNLAAHGRLATLDVPVAVALLATFHALYRYLRQPSRGRLLAAGVLLGLALLTKFTALLAVPVVAVLFLAGSDASSFTRLLRLSGLLGLALLVLNLGYGMKGTLTPVGAFAFHSQAGMAVARTLPAALPVPLPQDFVSGLDREQLAVERGEFGTYLRGAWMRGGSRAYYPLALLVKVPLATQLLVAACLLSILVSAASRTTLLQEAFCWLLPVVLLGSFVFFSNLNIGVRHLLPIFPFVLLGTSRLFSTPAAFPGRTAVVAAGVLGLVLTTARTHPHELSFFNSIAGGREHGHEWLIDSNLDWGQDLGRVRGYMGAHGLSSVYLLYFGHVEPALLGISYALPPAQRTPGTYLVSVNFAKGYDYVAPDHGRTVRAAGGAPSWLKSLRPVDRIGDSLWVYEVR